MTRMKALYAFQCRDYVLEQHGPEGLERLKAEMYPAARQEVYAEERVSTDWIAVEHALEHGLAYSRAFSTPGRDALEGMMTALAELHYRHMFRAMFASAPTALVVLEKSSKLWNRIYDQGETVLLVTSPTHVTKRIVDCPDLPRYHDRLTTPYYRALARAAGGRDVTAKHTSCVATGSNCCETVLRWKD